MSMYVTYVRLFVVPKCKTFTFGYGYALSLFRTSKFSVIHHVRFSASHVTFRAVNTMPKRMFDTLSSSLLFTLGTTVLCDTDRQPSNTQHEANFAPSNYLH